MSVAIKIEEFTSQPLVAECPEHLEVDLLFEHVLCINDQGFPALLVILALYVEGIDGGGGALDA